MIAEKRKMKVSAGSRGLDMFKEKDRKSEFKSPQGKQHIKRTFEVQVDSRDVIALAWQELYMGISL